jgi:hypothetical protein
MKRIHLFLILVYLILMFFGAMTRVKAATPATGKNHTSTPLSMTATQSARM